MRDLDKRLPTITVSARWSDGTDIMQARVLIDGKPVAERLDGKPISVNPGQHRLSVEVGDRRAEQALVANEGEKARLVRFVMDRPAAPRDVPDAPPPEAQPSSSGPGALPWVLAGVSVAALAGFGYFAIKGTNELSDLRDSCGPNCTDESLDDVKRDLLIADILLAASIVSAGASITLFVVSAPPAAGAEPTQGAFATVSGRF